MHWRCRSRQPRLVTIRVQLTTRNATWLRIQEERIARWRSAHWKWGVECGRAGRGALWSAGNGPATCVPGDFRNAQGGHAVLSRRGGERVINVVGAVVIDNDRVVPGSAPAGVTLNQQRAATLHHGFAVL